MAFGFDKFGAIRNLSTENKLLLEENSEYPESNIYDTKEELIISFYMPFVKEEDIRLNLGENTIELGFNKENNIEEEKQGSYFSKNIFNQFYIYSYLPSRIIPEDSEIKYENGFLTIYALKAKEQNFR